MDKKQLITFRKNLILITTLIVLWLCPLFLYAAGSDNILLHRSSDSHPFLGNYYKNIRWVSHMPYLPEGCEDPEPDEADYRGQIDIGVVDLDGDGFEETIKVIWGHGISDHSLIIELYKEGAKLNSLEAPGIQPNFKLEDLDGDKKIEVVIWGAVADPNMSQDSSDESKPFEGYSVLHLFKVEIYKFEQGKCRLSKQYISKNKYEPFCKEQPKE